MIVFFCGGTSLIITHASASLIYIIPFAILPIIVSTFFDTRTALYANYITIFISSIVVPSPFEFVLLQATAGMVTVSTLRDLSQRSQLVRTAIFIICTYCLFFLGYGLTSDSSIFEVNWMTFVFFVINGLLLLFAYPFISFSSPLRISCQQQSLPLHAVLHNHHSNLDKNQLELFLQDTLL